MKGFRGRVDVVLWVLGDRSEVAKLDKLKMRDNRGINMSEPFAS